MTRSYVGIQGVAAGPLKIGSTGVWVATGTHTTGAGRSATTINTLSIQNNLPSNKTDIVYAPIQAGLASTTDDHGVVTVEFLKSYYPDHTVPNIDLSAYTTLTIFNQLWKAVLGNKTQYNNTNSIELRVSNLENILAEFEFSNEEMESNIQSLAAQVYANSNSIGTLNNRIDNIKVNPFVGESLLIAGGAGPVEVII